MATKLDRPAIEVRHPLDQAAGPVLQWMELELPRVHPDYSQIDVPAFMRNYQQQQQQQGARQASKLSVADAPEVSAARNEFLNTIDAFNKSKARDDLKVDVVMRPDRRETHTWPELLSTLEAAQRDYLNVQQEGCLGRIRSWLRRLSELKGPIESWMRLLPSDSWQGSLICGGLKVILGAAVRLAEVREQISAAIEQIPLAISSVVELSRIYGGTMEEYGKQLIIGNLELMSACVQWFAKGCFKKFGKAILQGKEYGRILSTKVSNLQKLQKVIAERADLALHQAESDSRQFNYYATTKMFDAQEQTQKDVATTRDATVLNNDLCRQMWRLLQDNFQQLRLRNEHVTKILQAQAAQESLLADGRKKNLLAFLEYDPKVCLQDLSQSVRFGRILPRETQTRTTYIMQSAEIAEWSSSSSSNTLVVNAQESVGLVTHSTSSLFSTLLILALDDSASGVVLYYFCSQHTQEGPAVMVANLLGQLLSKALDNLRPSDLAQITDSVRWTYADLKKMFLNFLSVQLRKTPVYIIIDTASAYEDYKRLPELRDLWASLDQLGRWEDERQQPLKLIAVCPTETVYLGTKWDKAQPDVLLVPNEIPDEARRPSIISTIGGASELL